MSWQSVDFAHAMSAHPLLTKVSAAPASSILSASQKEQLLSDARKCIDAIMERRSGKRKAAALEPAHVAAALALMLGYYQKQNGTANPSDAARGFEHPISRPSIVTEKVQQLEELEAMLQHEGTDAGIAIGETSRTGKASDTWPHPFMFDSADDGELDAWASYNMAHAIAWRVWMPVCGELTARDTFFVLRELGWPWGRKMWRPINQKDEAREREMPYLDRVHYEGDQRMWTPTEADLDRVRKRFSLATVAAIIIAARMEYVSMVDECRSQMFYVLNAHLKTRTASTHRRHRLSLQEKEGILNELTVATVRAAVIEKGFSFPYAMMRTEIRWAKLIVKSDALADLPDPQIRMAKHTHSEAFELPPVDSPEFLRMYEEASRDYAALVSSTADKSAVGDEACDKDDENDDQDDDNDGRFPF